MSGCLVVEDCNDSWDESFASIVIVVQRGTQCRNVLFLPVAVQVCDFVVCMLDEARLGLSDGGEPAIGQLDGTVQCKVTGCDCDGIKQPLGRCDGIVVGLWIAVRRERQRMEFEADVAGHRQQSLHPVVEITQGPFSREGDMKSVPRMVIEQSFAHEAIQREADRRLARTKLFGKYCWIDSLPGNVLPRLQS